MRLIRLSLENWRGVTARDIEFDQSVTLIEGPNEIGKSTIVEALQMLFKELDSSKRREVKAIKPVDKDVGSRVEVEISAADYHFVYAKTYNKAPQTTLEFLAPNRQQLTGREAHERVEQVLEESVDMTLWDALLIDQGEKVGLANLQNSAGLARALDEAAGSTGSSDDPNLSEDGSLYAAVQTEYEKYYTLKTGREKFGGEEQTYLEAETELEAATARLVEVQANVATREEEWQAVRRVSEQRSAKEKELTDAQTILTNAEREQKTRRDILASVAESAAQLEARRHSQTPLSEDVAQLKTQASQAGSALAAHKDQVRSARASLDQTQADEAHLTNLETLSAEQTRLRELESVSKSLTSHLKTTASIKVDDAALEAFRQAIAALNLARGKRDAAATTVSITALTDLTAELDGDPLTLKQAESAERSVASALELKLPDIADIRIAPSLSVAELAEETEDAERTIADLSAKFEVNSLEQAVAMNQQRAGAQRMIDQLKGREADLLRSDSREEITQDVTTLLAECDRYIQQRQSSTELPESVAAARLKLSETKAQLSSAEQSLEDAQQKFELATRQHQQRDAQLRSAQQELAGLDAAMTEKQQSLERNRAEQPDQVLEQRARSAAETHRKLSAQMSELTASLDAINPDVAQDLLENAKAVLARANSDFSEAQTSLAVLNDRLEQAQANGRFEETESAQRKFDESLDAFESIRQRAQAAQLLWTTLNHHRDAARAVYVRPLKEAIERLGTMVFGGEFEVAIGDDWSIESRTLQGKTISFDALSVGAKEQLGILARLAAAQIVSKQGGVPLIIDDALGFSDPSRLETMGAAIATAGRDCQVIILTCTPGRFTHVGNAKVVRFAEG
jgi:DNA repair exonuclease SbcCD ATPase subunit